MSRGHVISITALIWPLSYPSAHAAQDQFGRIQRSRFQGHSFAFGSRTPSPAASSLSIAPVRRTYKVGALIVTEGEPGQGIFLLLSGTVQTAISKRGFGTEQLSLCQVATPAVLGLAATMLAQPSAVEISAVTATETAFISRAQFLSVLGEFPQAALAFSRLIAMELAHTYSHLSQLRINPRTASVSTHR
jgi:CRP-like cAMP-binding protein